MEFVSVVVVVVIPLMIEVATCDRVVVVSGGGTVMGAVPARSGRVPIGSRG